MTVPTVERGLRDVVFWSIEIAGERPSIESTSGLLHHLQELPRVGGERLDVAALPLGVDRVEGERRLAGAREAGDADQRVARQPDGDVLEVVLPGAVDDELFDGHRLAYRARLDRTSVRVERSPVGADRRFAAAKQSGFRTRLQDRPWRPIRRQASAPAPEDEAAEGEAEPEGAEREGADRDPLRQTESRCQRAERRRLLLGQLLAAALLAQRSPAWRPR